VENVVITTHVTSDTVTFYALEEPNFPGFVHLNQWWLLPVWKEKPKSITTVIPYVVRGFFKCFNLYDEKTDSQFKG